MTAAPDYRVENNGNQLEKLRVECRLILVGDMGSGNPLSSIAVREKLREFESRNLDAAISDTAMTRLIIIEQTNMREAELEEEADAARRKRDEAVRDADAFEPLKPFVEQYGPDMPTQLLPETLRLMVEATAEAYQVPAASVGTWCLGVVSACVAHVFEAHPNESWREPLNLYAVSALPPASRKSGALKPLTAPLTSHEREVNEANREERERCAREVRLLEKRTKRLEGDYSNGTSEDTKGVAAEIEAVSERMREANNKLRAVQRRTLFTSDTTPEATADIMSRNGERLAIISGEGDEFFSGMSRYAGDGKINQDFYLKCATGDETKISRKSRPGEDIYLESPALSLVLAVQPSVIEDLRTKAELRARGFIGRILFSVPEPTIGRRKIDPEPIPPPIEARYTSTLKALLALHGDRIAIRFDSEGITELQRFAKELEPRLGADGDLTRVSDWAGKLAGLIVRFSGIFHCVEMISAAKHPNDSRISTKTVKDAIDLGGWALSHASIALEGGIEGDPLARRIWRWISQRGEPSANFTQREAYRGTTSQNETVEATIAGLKGLIARGYVREVPQQKSSGGGRPSRKFAVNSEAIDFG